MPSQRLRPRPLPAVAAAFVKAHLGKHAFAPLTGTDTRAWNAFVYLLELWAYTKDEAAIAAMAQVIQCGAQLQHSVLRVFVQAIPGVLDWSDVAKIWPRIVADVPGLSIDAVYWGAFCKDSGVEHRFGMEVLP